MAKHKNARIEVLEKAMSAPVERSRPPAGEPFGMKSAAIQPEYIGVLEAQVITGISKWTWRQLAYTRKLESVKVGSRLLIPLSEIRRVLAEGRRSRADGLPAGVPSDRAAIVRKSKQEHDPRG